MKDYGRNSSNATICVILVLTGIKLFNDLISGSIVAVHFASLAIFIQVIIAWVLVSHKYADKAARGAK